MVIAVTGTRGKSSIVRMLASVLRESGRTVLAKTTGSQAQIVLPDGSVQNLPRRGIASILEQKNILKRASELKADCIVVEIMSIRPENHFVESQQILKPEIIVVTNIRKDHLEAMGETELEIAQVLRNVFPPGCSVYVPEVYAPLLVSSDPRTSRVRKNEPQRAQRNAKKISGILFHLKPKPLSVLGGSSLFSNLEFQQPARPIQMKIVSGTNALEGTTEFAENLNLVAAVSNDLGVSSEIVQRGIQRAQHDIGKLRIWKHKSGGKSVYLVNAFAANDPESTMIVYRKVAQALSAAPSSFTGLLNLREDRPDRTLQWIDALRGYASSFFNDLYAIGGHSHVVRRKVKKVSLLPVMAADELTGKLIDTMQEGEVLFGFGNIGGMGQLLVDHWQRVGEEYGI